jgi:hypothetical protein
MKVYKFRGCGEKDTQHFNKLFRNIEDKEEGKIYDAEIDLFTWSFALLEI